MKTMQEFVEERQITAKVTKAADNPYLSNDPIHSKMLHYRVVLSRPDGRRIAVPFSCGEMCNEPDAATVLDCLCDEANCPDTFEDFCFEYGENPDSRRAEKTFKACLKTREKLKSFLGHEFQTAMYELERM